MFCECSCARGRALRGRRRERGAGTAAPAGAAGVGAVAWRGQRRRRQRRLSAICSQASTWTAAGSSLPPPRPRQHHYPTPAVATESCRGGSRTPPQSAEVARHMICAARDGPAGGGGPCSGPRPARRTEAAALFNAACLNAGPHVHWPAFTPAESSLRSLIAIPHCKSYACPGGLRLFARLFNLYL